MKKEIMVLENEKEVVKKICEGNYEDALHYDCQICNAEYDYRKGTASSSEMIAVMCFLGIIAILFAVAVGTGVNYLLKMLGI